MVWGGIDTKAKSLGLTLFPVVVIRRPNFLPHATVSLCKCLVL